MARLFSSAGQAAIVAFFLTGASGASAQVSLSGGGGAALPVSHYGDIARLGVQAQVGAEIGWRGPLRSAIRALVSTSAHETPGDRSYLYGVGALVGYAVGDPAGLEVTPWGGIGGVVHVRSSSSYPGLEASRRGLALFSGLTVRRALGRFSPFLEASYARGLGQLGSERYPTEWVTLGAGVSVPLGG